MTSLHLLPPPRALRFQPGHLALAGDSVMHFTADLDRDSVLLPVASRLKTAAQEQGVHWHAITGPSNHPRLVLSARPGSRPPKHPEGYWLRITRRSIAIEYRTEGGLRAATATLRQILRQCGRRLPCLTILDYPDFNRRGVMLDVSRGRVPRIETLLDLVGTLADFKINEFQLYTEHTFAYRDFEAVWRDWGALTGDDILLLDAKCRELGIDLVPNQNSFGHLRYWLEYPSLRKLAEVSKPYPSTDGSFVRYPTTLAPNHPGTLPFLRELYDELLPHFRSRYFNVGCDETWDLGRGQSRRLCETRGKGRVYVDFLKRIEHEVRRRGRQMMFWGDIILHHPQLLRELPRDVIALNWGYEADHPFDREAAQFAASGRPFYVCPGTATWMSLIGRHDTAFANLQLAAKAGRRHGAAGYLNTDWGDGGHPQPLAVSFAPYLAGAALSWNAAGFSESELAPVLSRDVFVDPTGNVARAALALGVAHRKFRFRSPNVTPFGAVIAAPRPETRELFCRDGLKYYARIKRENILAAQAEVEAQRAILARGRPAKGVAELLVCELDLAARMALESCRIMLWQQALVSSRRNEAARQARAGVRNLQELDADYSALWPIRNKGTTAKSSPFFRWRIADYRRAG